MPEPDINLHVNSNQNEFVNIKRKSDKLLTNRFNYCSIVVFRLNLYMYWMKNHIAQ